MGAPLRIMSLLHAHVMHQCAALYVQCFDVRFLTDGGQVKGYILLYQMC